MSKRLALYMIVAASTALAAGCTQSASDTAAPSAAASGAMRSGSPADEQKCDAAVARETGNGETMVLSSDASQAGTEVIVGVGPQRARWSCKISGGVVQEVMSLTNEGAL